RVEHQLVRVEAVSGARLVGAVYAIPVDRAGPHIRQIAVPDLVGVFRQIDPHLAGLVEQAELDPRRIGGEQCEIDALAVPGRAQRMRQSFPDAVLDDRGHHTSLWSYKLALQNAAGKQHPRPAGSKRLRGRRHVAYQVPAKTIVTGLPTLTVWPVGASL